MPNFHIYVGCQAKAGKWNNYYSFAIPSGPELNVVRSSVACKTGPTFFNGEAYYGLLYLGYDNGNYSTLDVPRSHMFLDFGTGVDGNPSTLQVTSFYNLTPNYHSQDFPDADSSEPTTRTSALAQLVRVYIADKISNGANERNAVLNSFSLPTSPSAPTWNWGRSLTTAATSDQMYSTLYFDNWQTYLYWAINGYINNTSQYRYLRKYNQSGTLIWNQRLGASVAGPQEFEIGKPAGFDTGNVLLPISYKAQSSDSHAVLAFICNGSGSFLSNYEIWNDGTSGNLTLMNGLQAVVSSRPLWDRMYASFDWKDFGAGGPSVEDKIVILSGNGTLWAGSCRQLVCSNENLNAVGIIEHSPTGDSVSLFEENYNALTGSGLRIVRSDYLGNVIWQRRLTVTPSVSGSTGIANIDGFTAKIQWSSDDSFTVIFGIVTSPAFGSISGSDAYFVNLALTFPYDGSNVGTMPLEFADFDGDPNSENFLTVTYEEGDLVFADVVDIDPPDAAGIGLTWDTTNPFTQSNLSAPTATAISYETDAGRIK